MSRNFILIGAAGYIAPRHMQAIKDVGGELIAAFDPYDGVGVLDSYFPDSKFFTEFERFDRYIDKLVQNGTKIDYVSICSPNYLHDAHIRYGLRIGANVICEKPLVLTARNLLGLIEYQKLYSTKVNCILQLRLHESIIELKQKLDSGEITLPQVNLNYITSRGSWYHSSWKGDIDKSGGIAANIGVHFFDMLIWIFGNVLEFEVYERTTTKIKGMLVLEKAKINWFLSIDYNDIPVEYKQKGIRTYRTLTIDDYSFEFSRGFTELHTKSYQSVLNGDGFEMKETLAAISLVGELMASPIVSKN